MLHHISHLFLLERCSHLKNNHCLENPLFSIPRRLPSLLVPWSGTLLCYVSLEPHILGVPGPNDGEEGFFLIALCFVALQEKRFKITKQLCSFHWLSFSAFFEGLPLKKTLFLIPENFWFFFLPSGSASEAGGRWAAFCFSPLWLCIPFILFFWRRQASDTKLFCIESDWDLRLAEIGEGTGCGWGRGLSDRELTFGFKWKKVQNLRKNKNLQVQLWEKTHADETDK